MKVAVVNTAALNTGDAAILEATASMLRMAFGDDVEISVHDMSQSPARYYPALSFSRMAYDRVRSSAGGRAGRWLAGLSILIVARLWHSRVGPVAARALPADLREVLADYARADLVVSAGGTYLVPHYRLAPKLFEMLLALALGKPLVLFTQSLGPFHGHNRRWLRYVLRSACLILLRDETSRQHLLGLGVPTARVSLCADAAFAIAPHDIVPRRCLSHHDTELRVAISVRDWPHLGDTAAAQMTRYVDAVAELTRRLVDLRNARVTFVSTCQGVPEYWTDDSRIARRIVDRLPDTVRTRVEVDACFRQPRQLVERLGEFDIVVATRMHAAILSLCAGIPVVPVAYEFKTIELFRLLGIAEPVPELGTVTPDSLWESFELISRWWSTDHHKIWRRVNEARTSALTAVDHLRRAVVAT